MALPDVCTLLEVKQAMSGDTPTMDASWDTTIGGIIADVSALLNEELRQVRGQAPGYMFAGDGTPATRRFTGRAGTDLLLVDDAVSVSSVALVDSAGNTVQALAQGVDWLPSPLNGAPVTGLRRLNAWWPCDYGAVSVTMVPGYALGWPADLNRAGIAEVIRSLRGGQAGEDDRLGVTPYGQIVVSKALLQSTWRAVNRYRLGSSLLRRGAG